MNKKLFSKILLRTLAVIIILLAVILGLIYFLPNNAITPNKLEPVSADVVNFLLLGTDEGGMRTDTIMLASIDTARKKINVMSIPRDTKITIGKQTYKINSAYAFGKNDRHYETTIKYVKELTGLSIHYYAVAHPKSFRDVIDVLGGVRFDVPQKMHYSDPAQNLLIDLQPGEQLLNGSKAEQLTRFRGYPMADLQRVKVQQDFMKALFEQKAKPGYIFKLAELYSKISESVQTNVKSNDIPLFIKCLETFNKDSVKVHEMPGKTQMIGGGSYVVCDVAATKALIDKEFLNK
jgi:LCP family protein required for cell wall assembly